MKVALGQLKMSADCFWDLTPREFWNAMEGHYDEAKFEQRQEWERIRWQTCLLMNIQIDKNNKLDLKDLIEFEWEKEERGPVVLPTEEDWNRIKSSYGKLTKGNG